MLTTILPDLFCFRDSCRMYILRQGDSAILVDYGSARVLDALPEIGVRRVTDILITHHHRDQCQGLNERVPGGARVWVPESEAGLFGGVEAHMSHRALMLNYDMRLDRFSLLRDFEGALLLKDYARLELGDLEVEVLPAPGHTTGGVTLWAEVGGVKTVFCGDLIAAPGQLWSIAATQWTYNGGEGLALTAATLADLKRRAPDLLLPSHGEPIFRPDEAVDLTLERLFTLVRHRRQNPRLNRLLDCPYEPVTPHLLFNKTSVANSYVLLSASGGALVFDFGYDFMGGIAPGADRSVRRPWLYTLPQMKRAWGVKRIEAAVPTHYHDDHVAGLNLLRQVEGAQVWIPANFARILADPTRYDLPCLWFDPIHADRELPLGERIEWREWAFTLYALPGHTRFAAAILVEVDGRRALLVGDAFRDEAGSLWNYTYQNRVRPEDWPAAARLIRALAPDLLLTGHSDPIQVEPAFLDHLERSASELERLHLDLMPHGAEQFEARLEPYQAAFTPGQPLAAELVIYNPLDCPAEVTARLSLPDGWACEPADRRAVAKPGGEVTLEFILRGEKPGRAAAYIGVNGEPLGSICEMVLKTS